jgi:hypothetical protein
MHGICFDYPLQDWFEFKIPNTKIPEDFIFNALSEENDFSVKSNSKVVWLGGIPSVVYFTKTKKGNSWEMMTLTFNGKKDTYSVQMNKDHGDWLVEFLNKIAVSNTKIYTLQEIKSDFETTFEDFELFWFSKAVVTLKGNNLLVI